MQQQSSDRHPWSDPVHRGILDQAQGRMGRLAAPLRSARSAAVRRLEMLLQGSCHCRAVRFRVESHEPVPFMRCYCAICRKTAGTGGFAINLGADHATLQVDGMEHVSVYRATMDDGRQSSGRRHFCKVCGTALWLWDPTWPELVHPHAGAIDTSLPTPPSVTHMMLGSKPDWVEAHLKPGDVSFDAYPEESLADWHRRNGLGR